jgi:hypothetical protein
VVKLRVVEQVPNRWLNRSAAHRARASGLHGSVPQLIFAITRRSPIDSQPRKPRGKRRLADMDEGGAALRGPKLGENACSRGILPLGQLRRCAQLVNKFLAAD